MGHHREYPPPPPLPGVIKHRAGFMLGVFQGRFFFMENGLRISILCLTTGSHFFKIVRYPLQKLIGPSTVFYFSAFDKKQ